jgi:hypothetical protein
MTSSLTRAGVRVFSTGSLNRGRLLLRLAARDEYAPVVLARRIIGDGYLVAFVPVEKTSRRSLEAGGSGAPARRRSANLSEAGPTAAIGT